MLLYQKKVARFDHLVITENGVLVFNTIHYINQVGVHTRWNQSCLGGLEKNIVSNSTEDYQITLILTYLQDLFTKNLNKH